MEEDRADAATGPSLCSWAAGEPRRRQRVHRAGVRAVRLAAAILEVEAWLLVVPLVAWLAVLLPWYRHREALPAAGHQRGMYRALAAWAITDLVVLLVFAR